MCVHTSLISHVASRSLCCGDSPLRCLQHVRARTQSATFGRIASIDANNRDGEHQESHEGGALVEAVRHVESSVLVIFALRESSCRRFRESSSWETAPFLRFVAVRSNHRSFVLPLPRKTGATAPRRHHLRVWDTDFNSFSMPSNLHIETSFQVTPFSPSPRHPSRGSLLLFRRSKMAGATAIFSWGICLGKRAPERRELISAPKYCLVHCPRASSQRFGLVW